ncbi:MAG TPA: hypothetical protein VJ964_12680 [Balneolaceae bacterium]|nr:hypothetical protein [Balneolaceae bacterium]
MTNKVTQKSPATNTESALHYNLDNFNGPSHSVLASKTYRYEIINPASL